MTPRWVFVGNETRVLQCPLLESFERQHQQRARLQFNVEPQISQGERDLQIQTLRSLQEQKKREVEAAERMSPMRGSKAPIVPRHV